MQQKYSLKIWIIVVLGVSLIILASITINKKLVTGEISIKGGLTKAPLQGFAILLNENYDNTANVSQGYNLIDNKILDLNGNIVHVFCNNNCGLVYLMKNGNYLAKTDKKFGRYHANGDLVWENEVQIHHELTETNEGTILVLSQESKNYNNKSCGFQNIIEYSSDGEEIYRWSVYDNLKQIQQLYPNSSLQEPSPSPERKMNKRLNKIPKECSEYHFHMNSIQSIPKDMHGDARFKKGNLLVSLAGVNSVVIIDKDTDKIVWSWGSEDIDHQHTPRFLDNGNILIFDNGARSKGFSRVIELNPLTKKIVWEYKSNEPFDFFTPTRGSAQRLPNGNTLIGESIDGRAFEVMPNGEIVWELILSNITDENLNQTDFYRVTRITEKQLSFYVK